MKDCRVETQCLHLLIGDFNAGWIGALIQFGLNREAGCRGGMPNQVHNHFEDRVKGFEVLGGASAAISSNIWTRRTETVAAR